MREVLAAAANTGYPPREFAFFTDPDGSPEWETLDGDPIIGLEKGLEQHPAGWIRVELR